MVGEAKSHFMHTILLLTLTFQATCQLAGSDSYPAADHSQSNNGPSKAPDLSGLSTEDRMKLWLRYSDEQTKDYDVLRVEKFLDDRYANLNFINRYTTGINVDIFVYKSIDESSTRELESRAAGSRVNDQLCEQHLSWMLELLDEIAAIHHGKSDSHLREAHYRLARALDTAGRYDGGLLLGRRIFIGSPNQCQGIKLHLGPHGNGEQVAARSCMARLKLPGNLDPEYHALKVPGHLPDAGITVSTCLPETCHSKSFRLQSNFRLAEQFVSRHFKLPNETSRETELRLDSIYCQPDVDSPLFKVPISGLLLIGFICTWISLCLVASLLPTPSTIKNPLVRHAMKSLNLFDSWADFIQAKRNHKVGPELDQGVDLNALNPVRWLGCILVLFGHLLFAFTQTVDDMLRTSRTFEASPLLTTMVNASIVTDTFFVISGILFTYITLNKLHQNGAIERITSTYQIVRESLKFIAFRYLRLMPLYFLVFWFKKSLSYLLGPGNPLWDYGTNMHTLQGACVRESWWSPVALLAAFLPMSRQCLPQCWSVANDLAFVFLLAPLVMVLARRPYAAIITALVLATGSSLLMGSRWDTIEPDVRAGMNGIRLLAFMRLFNGYGHFYSQPQYRMSSILVGVLAGYALHLYIKGGREWPKWFSGFMCRVSIVIIIVVAGSSAAIPLVRNKPSIEWILINEILAKQMTTTGRFFWSSANAVVFLMMSTQWKDTKLMRISSGRFWKIISSLNYAILLIHFEVIIYGLQTQPSLGIFTTQTAIAMFINTYLACCLIGTVLHVVIENPLEKLIQGFLLGTWRRDNMRRSDKRD